MKFGIKKQFIFFFIAVAAVSLIFLSFILKIAIEKCFHDYVWTAQTTSHEKIVDYLQNYYSTFGTWKNFDGDEVNKLAKTQNRYFSLYDPHGELIFSNEAEIAPCCQDPNHKYWRNIYPVISNGIMTAWINIGQFTDHIYSPEDMAFRQSIFYGIILSFIITLFIALPLALTLSSRLTKPIRDLKLATDAMASGDLTKNINDTSSINEISGLVSSINHLRKSLYQQEALRKELTTDVSHELRTPVNIMQNQIEGMIDGVLPINKERLEWLLNEMQRLTGLISELEKITQIESDTFIPIYEDVNLSETVSEIVSGFEGAVQRKGLKILTSIEKDIIIKVQKDKLTQSILNLISNAYKFTDKGEINIKLYTQNNRPILEIQDTGIGIEKNDLPKIFERFYRVDKSRSRNTGGAGLGLAIVKAIADAHGWKINVISEKGKGSLFKIKF